MAQSPQQTNSSNSLEFGVATIIAVVVALIVLGVWLHTNDSKFHQEVYCPPQIELVPGESLESVIGRAAASTNATPHNIDTAVTNAPYDALAGRTAMICFDDTKQNVASVNGKRIPKE